MIDRHKQRGFLLNPFRFGGESPPPTGWRYWRIYITASNSLDSYKASLAEMEYRTNIGGVDVTGSGTANASSFFSSHPPSSAFDNSNSTPWTTASGAALPAWLSYDFGSNYDIVQITLTSGNDSARAARAPTSFSIQRSSDNVNWTTVATFSNEPAWGTSVTRTYTL